MDYDHLDPEGSLMDRIQALIQPPQSEESGKRIKKVDKEARKQGRAVNNDNCDSCGEGGDLLCCDRCPCAFHLTCCDPPLEEDDIPDGEWLCNECKALPREEEESNQKDHVTNDGGHEVHSIPAAKHVENSKSESPFSTLVKMTTGKNPTTFSLPPELKCNTYFPGDRKRKNSTEEKAVPLKNGKRFVNGDEEEHAIPPGRLCFACSRSELAGRLVHCDFCPLAFHMDCVNPPLTTVPSGMWMCPNHAEHAEPGLRDPRFSKRVQAYNDLRSNISQHTIKMNFLQRVHRLKKHPSFKRKAFLPTRRRATLVPQAIKDHYNSPPVRLLPEHVKKMQEPLPLHSMPLSTPTAEEQEEWLKCVISLQCGIAKHLTQPSVNKTLISNHVETSSTKGETSNSNAHSSTSTSTSAHSSSTGTGKEPVLNGLTSKSDLPNHVSSSSASSSVPNACISRVVTTTITTTSGGKTITKPLTILYASPSKLQTHMNGPLNTKSVASSGNPVNVCAVSSTHLPSQVLVKQEPKTVEKQLACSDLTQLSAECKQLSSDTAKLINDIGHFNNVKAKITTDTIKTVAVSSSSSVMNTTVSAATRTISTVTAAGSSGTSTTKVASSTPTKLIVLTSTNSGNIIKTIATAGLSAAGTGQIPGGSIVTLGTPGSAATVNPVKIGTVNASTPVSIGSSPNKVNQAAAATSMATANAINSICAAAGVDAFNELAKLDPRLIQVLAYQRLQQLLTQTKPVPPSPGAARKISFNGLKETIVLPQQAVPAGRSIAVLCPLSGTGPVCPMIHKCLSLGQGPDMDVCLQEYGHCNFISEKHCSIFYDETSKQYELINYSEHGTYVDNVLYSCDFSDKINRHVVSSKDLDPSKVSRNKLLAAAQVRQNSKPKGSRRTVGLGVQKIVKACNCTTSSSNLIGGSGAGWEGTALLHHGSYIKLGCAQFVFSITSQATKLPSSGKASSSSSSEKKPVVS